MADEFQLKMIVSAVDKASKVLEDVTGNTSKYEKNVKNLNNVLGTLGKMGVTAAATIGVAGVVMKKAFDLGKQGAALEYTAQKFDNLTKSIGTTSDALMQDLGIATKGLYSNFELMGSATDFVALGLANTHDEVVRLSAVSAGLGMNMNQLVLTLTNMTTMRFDALGVRVDGFKEKVAALEATGMSAADAFKEAFLRQAEDQLKLVGNAADSAMGDFMKFDAATKNLGDTLKISLIGPATDLAVVLTDVAEAAGGFFKEVSDVDKARTLAFDQLKRGNINFLEYYTIMGRVQIRAFDLDKVLSELEATEKENSATIGKAVFGYSGYRTELDSTTESVGLNLYESRKLGEYMRDQFVPGLDDVTKVTKEAAEAISEQLLQSMSDLKSFVGGQIGPSLDDFNDKQKDVQSEIVNIQGKIDGLNAKKWLTDAQKEELAENVTKLGELKTQYSDNADAHEEATKRILYDILLQRGALVEMTTDQKTQWNRMMTDIAKDWGIFDTATALAYQAADGYALNFANGAGMAASKDSILGMIALLERIKNTDWNVNATVTYQAFNLPSQAYDVNKPIVRTLPSNTQVTEEQERPGPGGASGLDFIVPGGYQRDTFPFRATSGERVQVTPAGKSSGGDTFNINISATGDGSALYRQFRQALDADLRARRNAGIQYAGL